MPKQPLDAWLATASGHRRHCGICEGDKEMARDIATFVATMDSHHVELARFWREYLVPRGFKFSREKLRDHVDQCLRCERGKA